MTEEEKAAKLADLRAKLAEKRAKKNVLDAEEAKANEALRRKAGKDAGKIRDELQAKETIKQAEKARLDKLEDAKARAEIKRKIEEDKAERRARAEKEKALREGGSVPVASMSSIYALSDSVDQYAIRRRTSTRCRSTTSVSCNACSRIRKCEVTNQACEWRKTICDNVAQRIQ